ncbi:MAG: VanZ family protein [Streptomyces sp.]
MSFDIALVVGVLGSLLIAVITWALGLPRRASQRGVAILGWLWAAGVVGLTFGTGSGGGKAVNVALLDLGNSADRVDFLLNTVMFVPGGILLSVLRARLRSAILFGLLASLVIESAQYVTESGRTADINDLLSNTIGCAFGYLCARAIAETVAHRNRRTALARSIGAGRATGRGRRITRAGVSRHD